MTQLSRRTFVATGLAALPAAMPGTWRIPGRRDDLDRFIEAEMAAASIPGLVATIVRSGRIAWSRGYGWADVAGRRPMDPDRTIQNIGSISKTFTGTAVMQLVEANRLDLDQDVSRHLPFEVRHPAHPAIPITPRLLLTHRSAIIDGPAYGAGYACGDPTVALGDWLREYLTPGGRFFAASTNFGAWEPGTTWRYSNTAYGLLGHLVERITGEPFPAYTRKHIFEPLGLTNTGWLWSDIDPATHAVTYAPIATTSATELEEYRKSGLIDRPPERHPISGEFQPFCRYNFMNYPDGALRISANRLARFLLAFMGNGAPLLRPETVRQMLTSAMSPTPDSGQGLTWRATHVGGDIRWGHGGADPGVRTSMEFRPSDGIGVIVFVNRGDLNLTKIADRLFDEGRRF